MARSNKPKENAMRDNELHTLKNALKNAEDQEERGPSSGCEKHWEAYLILRTAVRNLIEDTQLETRRK